MNISLTPELERQIAEKVDAGFYANPSEVVEKGLRLLFDSEARESALRADIRAGTDELDRGEGVPDHLLWAEIDSLLKPQLAG